MSDIRMCSKCNRKKDTTSSVEVLVMAGNQKFSRGQYLSAKPFYVHALNLLSYYRDACSECISDLQDRIDECDKTNEDGSDTPS